MGHVARVAAALVAYLAVFVLGIVLDGVASPIIQINHDFGVGAGPFGQVLSLAEGVRNLLVPALLLGITLWLLYGTVKEERREEQLRRIRPP